MPARGRTASRFAAVVVALMMSAPPVPAYAIDPPQIPGDPMIPPDAPAVPDQPMRQNKACNLPGVLPTPPVADIPTAATVLNLGAAHKISTGDGVTVAVIDTGVAPNPRLPRLRPGGDFIADTGGLADCDMHGTLVASLIAGTPAPTDQFVGVAPGATIESIRQSSGNFTADHPTSSGNPQQEQQIGEIRALAAAIVRAANDGARVINMSVAACIPVAHPINQDALGIAVRYAAVVKDVVLVAAAGNTGSEGGCQNNPDHDPLSAPDDPRNWGHVVSVSTPSWFSDYVISVGSTDNAGAAPDSTNAASFSMTGPWLDLAAPGVNVIALGPDGNPVNALPGPDGLVNMFGTSFSAAYVSGVAALVRSKFPDLSAAQVRRRLTATAHHPPRGVDNSVGYGLVDPVAALTYDLPPGDRQIVETHRRTLVIAPPPPPVNRGPQHAALGIAAGLAAVAVAASALLRRRRRQVGR
ncbi:MAG: type VII secretion-associated serine protease mycosin [Mycolicibacterium sp.]|uniref:type VII secretion-associated serine protease mycosin n=1 Tax=Mycolicibacterium sp. TaxID=2320850 RepID=UPI003D1197BA